MTLQIAVDVGCTTVVAATRDGAGEARLLEFEGEDGALGAMTASLVLRADGSARVGGDADRELDADPHRGVRGPLAHLESGSAVLELAGGPVPVVALVGELLARPLRVLARGVERRAPDGAVLALPSNWALEGRRARALHAAAALAGMAPVTLVPAALAAAALAGERATETVLVCDVGGRATQISIVDVAPGELRLLATTELAVGADLFDETLYLEVLRLLEDGDPAAAQRLEEQHLLSAVGDAAPDAAAWAACQAGLARAVRRCREALAAATSSQLAVGPPVGITFEIERDRLAGLVENELGLVAAAARAQVDQARAGASPGSPRTEPGRALLVGGGAQTPGLRAALAAELGLEIAIPDDPLTAVARGALLVAARDKPAAAPAPAPQPGGRRPARDRATPVPRPALRTVLDDVAAAVLTGAEIVAIVRHDSHQRVVRLDARGRVAAAHGIGGSDVLALARTSSAVVAASAIEAAVFGPDLRALTTLERPLLAAADGASAWIACAGDEQAAVLRLTTLAIRERAAHVLGEERLGLAIVPGRGGLRPGARSARPQPPRAHSSAGGGRLLFAIPARGRGGRPAQLLGTASLAGLGDVETKSDGPPWVTARAPSPGGAVLTLTSGHGLPAHLFLDGAELATWPAGVRISLVGAAQPGGPWVVAARRARWEASRLAGDELALVRAGDGAVEHASASVNGLWLVCESGGKRRLVGVSEAGELERLAALGAPFEPLGRAGGELLALVGPRGAPRGLVALEA